MEHAGTGRARKYLWNICRIFLHCYKIALENGRLDSNKWDINIGFKHWIGSCQSSEIYIHVTWPRFSKQLRYMATLLSIILGAFLENIVTTVLDTFPLISIIKTDNITENTKYLCVANMTEIFCAQNCFIKRLTRQYFGLKMAVFMKHGTGSTCHLADKRGCVQSFIHIDVIGPKFILMPVFILSTIAQFIASTPHRYVFEECCHDSITKWKRFPH